MPWNIDLIFASRFLLLQLRVKDVVIFFLGFFFHQFLQAIRSTGFVNYYYIIIVAKNVYNAWNWLNPLCCRNIDYSASIRNWLRLNFTCSTQAEDIRWKRMKYRIRNIYLQQCSVQADADLSFWRYELPGLALVTMLQFLAWPSTWMMKMEKKLWLHWSKISTSH